MVSLHQALIETIEHDVPPSVFERLLKTSESTIEWDPALDPLAVKVAMRAWTTLDETQAWVSVMDHLLQSIPLTDVQVRKLVDQVFRRPTHGPLALCVWNAVHARLSANQILETLSQAMKHRWDDIVMLMLDDGCPSDLSKIPTHQSPFAQVRHSLDLLRLLDHDFDPWQPTLDGTTGHRVLLSEHHTFHAIAGGAERASSSRRATLAMLNAAGQSRTVHQRVWDMVNDASRWEDLHAVLNTLGPAWLDVEDEGQSNVMHWIAARRPKWLPQLLNRTDVRRRGPVWAQRPDAQGRCPWEMIWLHPSHRDHQTGPKSVSALEERIARTAMGRAWLAACPPRRGIEPLMIMVSAALDWKCPLPNFNNPVWWDWLVRQGNVPAQQAWQMAQDHPSLLKDLDRLVWTVLTPKNVHAAEDWFNLDLWSSDAHPWLATYRLLTSRFFWKPHALPDTWEFEQHRFHMERARTAIEQGADWAMIEARRRSGLLSVRDDIDQVWHREVLVAWERHRLNQGWEDQKSVPMPRRRL